MGLCISFIFSENHSQIVSGSIRNLTALSFAHTHGNLTVNLRSADRNDSNRSVQAIMNQRSWYKVPWINRHLNLDYNNCNRILKHRLLCNQNDINNCLNCHLQCVSNSIQTITHIYQVKRTSSFERSMLHAHNLTITS